MRVGEFQLPEELVALIEAGKWPRNLHEANQQNLRSLAPEERIQLLAPEECRLFLYYPPFGTAASILSREEVGGFYRRFGAVDQIVPEATVEIGDFGLGSDAPIALDYRNGPTEPRVIRLLWATGGNRWVEMAPDFRTFAEVLGLARAENTGATPP